MSDESGLQMVSVAGAPENAKVIQFKGVLDETTSAEAREQLDQLLSGDASKAVIFDLSGLGFINSKGIGFLVSVHAHISREGKRLVLAGANEEVSDVMNLVGINTIIDTFSSLEEACGSLGQ